MNSVPVNGDLFFAHHVQVAVHQNPVNRYRQRSAEGIAGVRATFTVKGVAAGGFHIRTGVAEQPLQIARYGVEAKIGFAVAAGVRRRALLALTFSCNTMVSVSPTLRGRRSSNSG